MLCTSGGQFVGGISDTGGLSYRGGQTRLLALPLDATYLDLLVLLGKQWTSGSQAAGRAAAQVGLRPRDT